MLTVTVAEYSYEGQSISIFKNFELKAKTNKVLIRGPSGCGKTTLLKLMSGYLGDKVTIKHKRLEKINSSLVVQNDGLLPWLTGLGNLKLISKKPLEKINSNIMDHLSPLLQKYAYQMSFGQRRFIELVRAVIAEPDVMCLDEPFNYLDIKKKEIITSAINDYIESNANNCLVLCGHYDEDKFFEGIETYSFPAVKFPVERLLDDG